MGLRPLVTIVHYHLNSGGVTRVISQAVDSLSKSEIDILILAGSPCSFNLPSNAKFALVEELNYQKRTESKADELCCKLSDTAIRICGRKPDIWHFHNHSIGKNTALSLAGRILAEEGQKILFQIHDFPEDRRPQNYANLLSQTKAKSSEELENILYPLFGNTHYAVLNNRDYSYLKNAGFPNNNLHLLQNPVNLPAPKKTYSINPFEGKKLWLYPSRCIRRKNLGEFLLWAALNDKKENIFASTLMPTNPSDLIHYNRWKEINRELNLDAEFEIGTRFKNDFSEWINYSYSIVTTSVGEGFGLAFLEPFLFKKPITGRDIEDITIDFKNKGISYKSLYSSIRVPIECLGEELLYDCIASEIRKMYSSYNQKINDSMIKLAFDSAVKDGLVDFGRLNEFLQEKIIRKIVSNPSIKNLILPNTLTPVEYDKEILENNLQITRENYGLEKYGRTLVSIYQNMLSLQTSNQVDTRSKTLLSEFLKPQDFYLLRS